MSIERYPQKLAISLQDFRESGWKEAINQEAIVSYKGMWLSLYYAAFRAIENGRLEHGKVLWLLADACSMVLSPSGSNEPFKSRFVGADVRPSPLMIFLILTLRSLPKLLMWLTIAG